MSVVYTKSDSIGRKIIPAPLVSINKTYQTNNEGTKRGTAYSIVLTGTILPFRGSPSGSYSSIDQAFYTLGGYPPDEIYSGNNADFNNLLRKQEALRWLFNEDGGALEWQPAGGQPPVKCYPRVLSISFSEGQWSDRCDYTIELEAPWIYINGTTDLEDNIATDLISASTETWSFEEIGGRNNKQYRVTHDVSADGKLGYEGANNFYDDKLAWEHAKDFVDARVSGTVDNDAMFAALGASDKINGHYYKIIRIDKDSGTYGITENWLLSNDNTYEEKQFTVDYDASKEEYNITYQGVIYGVASASSAGNIANINTAKSAIPSTETARTTAINYIGSLLGDKQIPNFPNRKTFSLNQQDGTVNFSYQWTTSDDDAVFIAEDAQYSYSNDNLLHTLTYNQIIEGQGDSIAERLSNAENAIHPTQYIAKSRAQSLINIDFNAYLSSTTKSVDKRSGIIRVGWTWTSGDSHNTEINIQTQKATPVLSIIPIPGRAAGPIIQNMGTQSSEIITVTIRSKRHTSRPNLSTESYGEDGTIMSDNVAWNPTTGVAERVTRFLKET